MWPPACWHPPVGGVYGTTIAHHGPGPPSAGRHGGRVTTQAGGIGVLPAPIGAKGGSHGWSEPQANETRGSGTIRRGPPRQGWRMAPPDRPIRRQLPRKERRIRGPLRPRRGGRRNMGESRFHGFRVGRLRRRAAPPVATPFAPSERNRTRQACRFRRGPCRDLFAPPQRAGRGSAGVWQCGWGGYDRRWFGQAGPRGGPGWVV